MFKDKGLKMTPRGIKKWGLFWSKNFSLKLETDEGSIGKD